MIFLITYVFLGPFDWVILGILGIANILLWKNKIPGYTGCFMMILFAFILPLISMFVEIERSSKDNGLALDGFELLYTYFRFPVYWVIGIIQAFIFFIINKLQKLNLDKNI